MALIPNFPQNLMDEHHHWHDPSAHPGTPGGRQHPFGSPGGGLEFLQFHRDFMARFHAWYDSQPFADQSAVAAWTSIPAALKNPNVTGWSQVQASQEARITTSNPPFASADALGTYIEGGIHGWIHGATATVFNEPVVGTLHSPQSTYFYKIHGLVDFWWRQWQTSQKTILGDTAVFAPDAVAFLNNVYLAWAGTDIAHRLNVMSSSQNGVWTNKITLGDTSPVGVSLRVFNNNLYLTWSGTSNQQLNVMRSSNGTQWSNKITLGDKSPSRPVLASHSGRFVLGWVGTDAARHLNVLSSSDGSQWSNKNVLGDTSIDAPALASFQGRLYIAWTGTNSARNLNVMSSGDFGATWQNKRILSDTSIAGPYLYVDGNRLLLGWAGRDSNHRINFLSSADGLNFGNKVTLDDTSDYTPGLVTAYGSLATVWTGRDSQHHLNVMKVSV